MRSRTQIEHVLRLRLLTTSARRPIRRLTQEEMVEGSLTFHPEGAWPPRTRADCVRGVRPCPWASCRHHLLLDVRTGYGSIKTTHQTIDVNQIPETCSLDVAERGGISLTESGRILGLTAERVRQIERIAVGKLAERLGGLTPPGDGDIDE